jgi:glycosyltransferase involved in cell wall biosynthesis
MRFRRRTASAPAATPQSCCRPAGTPRSVRMDAHVHSAASSAPVIPILGPLGVPESYSPPEKIYDLAKSRGMDLVTITDHDTIDGAMSLVERGFQDFIVGEEVTVLFPEDACKLHVVVWCLTPDLHAEIGDLGLRKDVYQFAHWLRDRNLPHALAHPLYVQNHRLTRWHIDRCALLFKCFETLNGAHSGTHRTGIEAYLEALTPGRVLELIDEHKIEPLWPRIWDKGRTGGSDDHALLNVGRTWTSATITQGASDPGRDFFREIMNARSAPGGVAGHSTLLAHQLTSVGARYIAESFFGDRDSPLSSLIGHRSPSPRARFVASRLLGAAGIEVRPPSLVSLVAGELKRLFTRHRARRRPPLVEALLRVGGTTLGEHPAVAMAAASRGNAMAEHEALADFVCDLYAAVHRELASGTAAAGKRRSVAAIRDQLTSYLMLELTQVPYLFSLFHQNKERAFVDEIERESIFAQARSAGTQPPREFRPMRLALFTDTLGDVNGVSRFINDITDQALISERNLHVFTSTRFPVRDLPTIHNFAPVLAGKMPKYDNLELVLPPVVKMLRAIDAHQPDAIHISTPGPVGVVGYIAARMLRVPVVGVYHTDFPAYIDELFENDPGFSRMVRLAMSTFYKPFSAVFTRSHKYIDRLEELGVSRSICTGLKPGMQTRHFRPDYRRPAIWSDYGVSSHALKVLYVGRLSLEKNMPMLTRIWKSAHAALRARGIEASLVLVGDGPHRAEMERELHGCNAHFLGFRYGQELSTIYASSDLFVFPSVTDTLGQVVMEAQASGLPALVSNIGGPQEIVRHEQTGFVLPSHDATPWANAIFDLATDQFKRESLGRAAHEHLQSFSISASFDHFWQVHVEAWRQSIDARATSTAHSQPRQRRPDSPRTHDGSAIGSPSDLAN